MSGGSHHASEVRRALLRSSRLAGLVRENGGHDVSLDDTRLGRERRAALLLADAVVLRALWSLSPHLSSSFASAGSASAGRLKEIQMGSSSSSGSSISGSPSSSGGGGASAGGSPSSTGSGGGDGNTNVNVRAGSGAVAVGSPSSSSSSSYSGGTSQTSIAAVIASACASDEDAALAAQWLERRRLSSSQKAVYRLAGFSAKTSSSKLVEEGTDENEVTTTAELTTAHAVSGVFLTYLPQHVMIALLVIPPFLVSFQTLVIAITVVAALYLPTYLGRPSTRPWRASKRIKQFLTRCAEAASTRWYPSMWIACDTWPETTLYDSQKLMFGYHPHGLCPALCVWAPLTRAWGGALAAAARWDKARAAPAPLVASVLHRIPILRDLLQAVGSLEASKEAIRGVLSKEDNNGVLLVPGGISELIEDGRAGHAAVVLVCKHKGFVREALLSGASLVPVFCFGEHRALRNLFPWRSAMRAAYRLFGIPLPYLPSGHGMGLLPLPATDPIAVVVGAPLPPPSDVTPEQLRDDPQLLTRTIDAHHYRYYCKLSALYYRHRAAFGYGDVGLVLDHLSSASS